MTEEYDVVIVGGGIHGAGVAQAVSAVGHRTLLLERRTIASGTSSRSSKLIHGGLRYLETAQFSLVRECLRERSLLLRLAPSLVKLRPFYIPVYASTVRRPWKIRAGLSLYAFLGGLRSDSSFQSLPRRDWEGLDGLKTQGLQAVFRYYDAQTDDAALTRAVVRSAKTLGATMEEGAAFLGARLEERGVVVNYRVKKREMTARAKVLINAGGPWVNRILEGVRPLVPGLAMDLVQGAHIILAGSMEQGIYYMEAPRDGRAVFAIPWRGNCLVGTTETPFEKDPDDSAPLPEEIDYLLETVGHYFPEYSSVGKGEILESFAGLRVLPKEGGSPFRRSRETFFHVDRESHPRVLTIYGGKLTSYRAASERVLRLIASSLPPRSPVARTEQLTLEA